MEADQRASSDFRAITRNSNAGTGSTLDISFATFVTLVLSLSSSAYSVGDHTSVSVSVMSLAITAIAHDILAPILNGPLILIKAYGFV